MPLLGVERKRMGKFRPQIFFAIICATVFAVFAAWVGYKMDAIEILTGILGAYFGFLAGVSFKILESEI